MTTDSVILVAGAGGALGGAVIEELSRQSIVVAADRHPPAARDRVEAERLDATDEKQVDDLLARVVDRHGRLDGLVNTVGTFAMADVADQPLADFRRLMALNLEAAFLLSRAAVRAMRPRGRGRLVHIGSVAAQPPGGPGAVAYSTSKAALTAFALGLSEEVRPSGLTVNVVAPSVIDTPANRQAMGADRVARYPSTAQIARVIRWLVLDEVSAIVSGAVVPVFGTAPLR